MTDQTNTTGESNTQLVWYASYGSNMDRNRFLCYIQGGRPAGSTHADPGCDDKTLPLAEMPIEIPRQLYFADKSGKWTGGVAFISHNIGKEYAKGKAYLITAHQFEQIVAQEGDSSTVFHLDIDKLRELGQLTIGDGMYDEMIYCGERDGYPVISFTSPLEWQRYNKPAPAYLKMIASGLMSTHSMPPAEVASYLLSKPGVNGHYTYAELLELIPALQSHESDKAVQAAPDDLVV